MRFFKLDVKMRYAFSGTEKTLSLSRSDAQALTTFLLHRGSSGAEVKRCDELASEIESRRADGEVNVG